MLQKDYVTMYDIVLLLDLATRTSKISFPAFSLNTTLGLSLSLMKSIKGSAEHISTRQLILQCRLQSRLVFVYIYIYNMAIYSHTQECNYRLSLKHVWWYILVPVCFWNLTPPALLELAGPWYAVWTSAGMTQWSCPHLIGAWCELVEIYCYREARAVPVQ